MRCHAVTLPAVLALSVHLVASTAHARPDQYTITNLGTPPNADTTIAVRMNNLGQVAGYSIYYGQGEPSIKPWIWTPDDGFTVLPPPPDMYQGRARAMDISDTGIIAGDGGFDIGIAWRYENGQYETFGPVGGMSIAYLGGVNDAGDVTGTAKDSQIITEDEIFLDVNGTGTQNLTPGNEGGRGVDINNAGQICGYTQGGAGFGAFLWDEVGGFEYLGAAGLAYSFANGMNESGQVVGTAQSASGNTHASWIYTPGEGQQLLPTRGATAINVHGHVVGTYTPGADQPWLWTPQDGSRWIFDLVNYVAAGYSAPTARDINDAGQILASAYDNNSNGYRPIIFTPLANGTGACCLAADCLGDVTEADCSAQAGEFRGNGSICLSCSPVGACCLTDGDCVPFTSEADCATQVGFYQGDDTSCALAGCATNLPNDDCAGAVPIVAGDLAFSTLGATTDGPTTPTPCASGFSVGFDIWYTYEPEGTGTLTVSTCNQASFDTQLEAYAGTCGALAMLACNGDDPSCAGFSSLMEVPVTCGEPVLLRVGGFSTQSGTGTLSLAFDGAACAGCMGDTNGDAMIDIDDVVYVIMHWLTSDPAADITQDGRVDVDDIVEVILRWGACP